MTDANLRELERRWKETGAVQDEAALLAERVRVGELEQSRLELAAYCGHAGAQIALAEVGPRVPQAIGQWIRGMERWGKEVACRVALSAVTCNPRWHDLLDVLSLVLDWLRNPSAAGEERIQERSRLYDGGLGLLAGGLVGVVAAPGAFSSAVAALNVVGRAERRADSDGLTSEVIVRVSEFRAAIEAGLVPWALGYGDPVRERVEAFHREAE